MSLQFIFGNAGSGKSHYVYEKVIEESIKNPGKNYIILVPEQFTMQIQKEIVNMHPAHGIMNIDVQSFGRLAHRIFEETGNQKRIVLDDMGKNLVLRKAASGKESELKIFGKNLRRLGYISEIKSVISELMQYDIGPEKLDEIREELGETNALSYKLEEIQTLYESFLEILKNTYITGEEILDLFSEVAGKSRILKDSVIVLDEFTGFTPVQNRLIGKFMQICGKVMVTVNMDEREDPYKYQGPYELFALGKKTVVSLSKMAAELKVEIEEPILLYQNAKGRFEDNEVLAFLEKAIFRYQKRRYQKEQDVLRIRCLESPAKEAMAAAGEIRRMVRQEGIRYRDIAVVARDMNAYAYYLQREFVKFDIPLFMDHKRSILLNPFVEYVRSLLAMANQHFSYESVFRFLRTELFGFSRDEVDLLENYVRALGIQGYKKWQSAWIRRTDSMDTAYLEEVNRMRVQFVERMEPLMFVLRQRKKTVQDISAALYEFFVSQNIEKKLEEQGQKLAKAGEVSLSKEYEQIYRIVLGVLEQFVSLLGGEEVSLLEYCELIDAGLAEAKVGIIPPSMDQVLAGDFERTRLKDIKVLFVLGVNDTIIPGSLDNGGILSAQNREELKNLHVELSPGAKEKAYVQKYYLYLNLTKPSQKLILSYSRTSSEGKSLRPAYLVSDLLRLFPGLSVEEEKACALKEKELSPRTAFQDVIRGLKEGDLSAEWLELYRWYKNHPEWEEKIRRILDGAFYCSPQFTLMETTAEKLYGNGQVPSATRMERFAACAFSHYLTYGLRLKEREQYEFRALDFGNIFHRAVERYSRKVEREGLSWTEVGEKEREEWICDSVEESIADYGNTILYSSARNEYLVTRLKKMMRRTIWALTNQLACGDFKPDAYEVKFAGGKIDRLDICEEEDKVYVKIIDYKTGSKSFDMTAFYHGIQVQLVVYLNAALAIEKNRFPGKEIIPAGIFYYQMKDPFVPKEMDEEKLKSAILKELRLDGLLNENDEVIAHLDKYMGQSSEVIPAGRKKDGTLNRYSKAIGTEEFHILQDYAKKLEEDTKKKINQGEITPNPYEMEGKSGCDYCRFRSVCGFDEKLEGYAYRRWKKLDDGELFEKMKGELES